MSDYGHLFDGLERLFKIAAAIIIVSVPLAIWKLVDISMWIISHVKIEMK